VIIDIHDVGHGACAVVTAPNGKRLMIDCGHSNSPLWRPSLAYASQEIEGLVISNYDEDHVSDLPRLMANTRINYIVHNDSVSPYALGLLKMECGAGPGIRTFAQWKGIARPRPGGGVPDLGAVSWWCYWNRFPSFFDENNLSIVTFIEFAGFKAVFCGDLEVAGWKRMLMYPEFVRELRTMDVFVASHHGRLDGCCDEVFKICNPQIVVMSDRDRQFDSQETTGWYQARTTGIIDASGDKRHVYTTRCDGHMRIRVWVGSDGLTWWRIDPYSRLRAAS
jgi:beta-lactamase superfamily II metal-dependent hydrolase